MGEWQPYSTAPKDGEKHIAGLWVHTHGNFTEWDEWQVYVGYLDDAGDFVDINGDDTGWTVEEFTHWMRLPKPPKETSDD